MAASTLSYRSSHDHALPAISTHDSSRLTQRHHHHQDALVAAAAARRLSRDERRKPRRVVIFCNGDVFFKGKKISIFPSRYVSYHDLLQDLTSRMPGNVYLPNGVRQVFSPTSGRRLNDVSELKDGSSYVCAGNETFKSVRYGNSSLTPWGKGPASTHSYDFYNSGVTSQVRFTDTTDSQAAGYNAFPPSRFLRHQKLRQNQSQLQQQTFGSSSLSKFNSSFRAGKGIEPPRKPKVITVVKDGSRPRQIIKILLNRRGIQSFQQLMADISESFGDRAKKDRLKSIFTISGREVKDTIDFFRDEELFVGTTSDTIGIDRVADLLDELYPNSSQTKMLLKDWEKRLRRFEKRSRLQQAKVPAMAGGLGIEERDSGYDESDLTNHEDSGTNKAHLKRSQSPQPRHQLKTKKRGAQQLGHSGNSEILGEVHSKNRLERVIGRQRADEIAESEKRRLSVPNVEKTRPLPLLHDTPSVQASQEAINAERQKKYEQAELQARLRAEEAQRLEEEKKLKEEAQAAKSKEDQSSKPLVSPTHVPHPKQATSPHTTPRRDPEAVTTDEGKKAPILPPIPSKTEGDNSSAAKVAVSVTEDKHLLNDRLSPVTEEDGENKSTRTSVVEKSKSKHVILPDSDRKKSLHKTSEKKEAAHAHEDKSHGKKSPVSKSHKKKAVENARVSGGELVRDNQEQPRPLIRPISSSRFITERYDMGRTMGDGNFAIVRACKKKNSNNEYAIKIIDKSKLRGKEQMIINEVRIMKLCSHSNIVKLKEEFETKTEIYLVMELVKGGDLFDAISQAVKFNEVQAAPMVRDMADALYYLHSRNIVHRDMKPENLLVYRKDGKLSLKLGDFGLAMEVDRLIYTVCGTPTYVAPEILEERGYGLEVDLWAVGVIAYILLCGFPPFRSRDRRQSELFEFIKSGQYEFLSPYWDNVSNSAKDLIQHLLIVDRKKRYTAVDILCHPWILTLGGTKKLDTTLSMADYRVKFRDELHSNAKDALDEFREKKLSEPLWKGATS